MPCGASSTPAVLVSIRTPPLAAQYGAFPGIGQSSWIEEMLMIRPPPPWVIICLAASWTPKKALLRSIPITTSNSCSVVSRTDVRVSIPALLTITSRRPNAATVSATREPRSATLETSACWIRPRPPAASIAASVAVAAAAFRW